MELKPHDLIKINHKDDLINGRPLPDWAAIALTRIPYVVVTRAHCPPGFAAIGIRGNQRGKRCASCISFDHIVEIITPESLTIPQNWLIGYPDDILIKPIETLKAITPQLQRSGYIWGPTGSVGFELATGVHVLSDDSDLDLVIQLPEPITVPTAIQLLYELEVSASCRLDVQISTPLGGVSLKEFCNSETVMVKTVSGPVIINISNIWNKKITS